MILCVDPETSSLSAVREALSEAGFDTVGCGSAAEAREVLEGGASVDCLVTEYDLPDGTGLELARRVRETAPDAACLLFTDTPVEAIDTAAFGDTVAEYVGKEGPDPYEELVDLVEFSLAFQSQTAYPLSGDEAARVAALERYSGDPAALSESLRRLTELAVALFGVDAAVVGLVDAHHEEFVSCYGTSLDPTDREETVCTYAILEDEVTVVEDTADDPRFDDIDLPKRENIRFYAGANLSTPDGHAIGSFCLHDGAPREFSTRERELLQTLADEAMDKLELHRRLREQEGADP